MAATNVPKVYTTVEDIDYHLSNVFAMYPTLYANHDALSLHLQVIAPLIKNSREFCEAIKSKRIKIGAGTGSGGFSQAGPLNIRSDGRDKVPMASGVSFAPDGSWISYFMETFSKTSHVPVPLSIRSVPSSTNGNGHPTYIISSDPVHEAIIGALVSHLFDIGVAPSFMKYLGMYTCDDIYEVQTEGNTPVKNMTYGKPYFLFEKSDIELYQFLGGEMDNERKVPGVFSQITPYDIMIWSTQLAHTQFVGKFYFGLTHIDGHAKNIMLTYTGAGTSRAIKWEGKNPTPLTYGKTPLDKAAYYEYIMPFKVNKKGDIVDDSDPSGLEARMILENNGLLPKEIDFGLSVANLKESVVARAQNIAFINEPTIYDIPVMGYPAATQENKGDLDYNYTTLNIVYRIGRAIKIKEVGYQNLKRHYEELWTRLLPFWQNTLPPQFDPSNIQTGGPVVPGQSLSGRNVSMPIFAEFLKERGQGNGSFYMRARAVGTTSDIRAPLKKIWEYFIKTPLNNGASRFSTDNEKGYIQVSRDNSPLKFRQNIPKVVVPYFSDPRLDNLQKFMKYNFALWRACIPKGKFLTQDEINNIAKETDNALVGKNSIEFCELVDKEIKKYDPNSKKSLSFFTNLVAAKSPIWDPVKRMLHKNITKQMLDAAGFQRSRTHNTQLFTLRFNPSQIGMTKIAKLENLTFNSDQRMTNYKPPLKIGEHMKMVNVHLIYISPVVYNSSAFGITCDRGKDLYKTAKERLTTKSGVSVNGGYFIVPGNYMDPLNYMLNQNLAGYPVGYFYSEITPQFNGTFLPIPRSYQESFATIYVDLNNALHIERSLDFENQHETVNEIVLYALTQRPQPTNVAVERKVIKMVKDQDGILRPVKNTNFEYRAAFECGPILIWDGKIEYTRKKMDEALFQVDLQKDVLASRFPDGTPNIQVGNLETYKVVSAAQNSKMYFNEVGETNFPYGQRHSNSLMIHNVLCETQDGDTLFVFVEGRGFDAVGLDRAQLAELISRFNVKKAVSLDGGFSANAVLKRPNSDETGYYWLLNDPDKRSLSTTIHFQEIGGS